MVNKQMKTLTIGGVTYEIVDAYARENKIDKNSIVQERGNSTTAVMSQKAATDLFALKSDLSTLSLGVHTDGLIHIFMNGVPVGDGVEIGAGGDVVGYVDIENNIVIRGSLPDGTYTIQYEMEDGSSIDIGNLVLDTNVYYTVTNNLTNCTSSNSETRIVSGNAYSATISANDGYALSSVVVTMGGVDITSSAVSGGAISIASVSGNIVITAVAEEIIVAEPTNWLPIATLADGDTNTMTDGLVSDKRLGSSDGSYRDLTGHKTTGFIPVKYGDELFISNITIGGTNEFICYYGADKLKVTASGNTGTTLTAAFTATDGGYKTPINSSAFAALGNVSDNIAYIRLCGSGITENTVINIKRNGEWL